jgi:hypothetical protein
MNEAAYHAILQRLGVEPISPGPAAPAGPASPGVTDRVAAFRRQLVEWTASGRIGAPVLGLGVAVALGSCVGCGETLAAGRAWRCAACVQAVEVVLGLVPPTEPAP